MEQKLKNIVFDTNYTSQVNNGWFPNFDFSKQTPSTTWNAVNQNIAQTTELPATTEIKKDDSSKKKPAKWFIEQLIQNIFPPKPTKNSDSKTNDKTWNKTAKEKKEDNNKANDNRDFKNKNLKDQVQAMIQLSDKEYSDKKLTSQLRQYIWEVEKHYQTTIADYKSHIAPSFWEFKSNQFNVSWLFGKSYYVQSYPSYIDALWTRDLLSFNGKRDMSFFLYPEDDAAIQWMLRQKATQLKAEINESVSKGITLDTEINNNIKMLKWLDKSLPPVKKDILNLDIM